MPEIMDLLQDDDVEDDDDITTKVDQFGTYKWK